MLAGRGVALGLGGMNLTDSRKGPGSSSTAAHYYLQQQSRRCSGSNGDRKNSNTSFASGFRASPFKRQRHSTPLADIPDVDDQRKRTIPMEKPERKSRKEKEKEKLELEQQKKRIVVKKAFSRRTFWVACRAIIFGFILVLLGAAMCTIGYYNEHFSLETVMLADNVTAVAPNPSKKFQFQSLTYIGPVVMGAGAFVLMMACVTTLESRDRQARIYQEQQAQLDAERTPLSRQGTGQKKSTPSAANTPGPSALKSSTGQSAVIVDASSSNAERGSVRKSDPQKSAPKSESAPKPIAYQPAELVPVPSGNGSVGSGAAVGAAGGGVINRCFTRDDSKTASKPDTDSGPSGTTTTTLTWSKNGGPRCETDVVCKYPSASCIDSLIRKPDERALLQRFLEDQSRLVEDRLNRRIQQQNHLISQNQPPRETESSVDETGFRSASLDAPASAKLNHSCSRNFRSEEMAPRKNVVAAEVHHAGDASPGLARIPAAAAIDAGVDSTNSLSPRLCSTQVPATSQSRSAKMTTSSDRGKLLRAPVIAPDALELFSPMSVSPDTPASQRRSDQKLESAATAAANPPPAPSRSNSPEFLNADRSISGSYVTVVDGGDDFAATIDFFNANVVSSTPVQQNFYNAFADSYSPPPPPSSSSDWPLVGDGSKKLYDSVFLTENLRSRSIADPKLPSIDRDEVRKEKIKSREQTGVLCKDWKEMNANYLRSQQPL